MSRYYQTQGPRDEEPEALTINGYEACDYIGLLEWLKAAIDKSKVAIPGFLGAVLRDIDKTQPWLDGLLLGGRADSADIAALEAAVKRNVSRWFAAMAIRAANGDPVAKAIMANIAWQPS